MMSWTDRCLRPRFVPHRRGVATPMSTNVADSCTQRVVPVSNGGALIAGTGVLHVVRMAGSNSHEGLTAYCLKCKRQGPISNPEPYTLKNQRKAVRGSCGHDDCDGRVSKIVG